MCAQQRQSLRPALNFVGRWRRAGSVLEIRNTTPRRAPFGPVHLSIRALRGHNPIGGLRNSEPAERVLFHKETKRLITQRSSRRVLYWGSIGWPQCVDRDVRCEFTVLRPSRFLLYGTRRDPTPGLIGIYTLTGSDRFRFPSSDVRQFIYSVRTTECNEPMNVNKRESINKQIYLSRCNWASCCSVEFVAAEAKPPDLCPAVGKWNDELKVSNRELDLRHGTGAISVSTSTARVRVLADSG